MRSPRLAVRCLRCSYELAEPFAPCPKCLADGISATGDTYTPLVRTARSVPDLAAAILPAGAANGPPTPLRRLARLETDLDVSLWLKDERAGPTGSYKDRLARVAALKAAEMGHQTVVLASSGNHGAAVAAAATAQGLNTVVVTMTTIAPAMRRLIEGCGGAIVPLTHAEDRWTLVRETVDELGWFPAGNFHNPPIGSNPYVVDGYQPIAWEIVEQLQEVPDWVAVPVGYGDGLSGIAKGFRSLLDADLVDRLPRMLAVDTTGTIADAFDRGEDQPRAMPVRAPSALSIACPQATYQSLHAVRVSEGAPITVDDAAALEARTALSRQEGAFVELSSAAAFAGVVQARADGRITPDQTVVVVGTSGGLKDQLLPGETDGTPDPVPPTLDAMRELLAARP